MNWNDLISALALGMFIVVLYPVAKSKLRDSPRGTNSDWLTFVVIILVVMLFIGVLMGAI